MKPLRILPILLAAALLAVSAVGCPAPPQKTTATLPAATTTAAKPVIYLYPEKEMEVSVSLEYMGELTCIYPIGAGSWIVTAFPDGRLINRADGKEYSYLYWEGLSGMDFDFSKGFVVKGADTALFLQDKLAAHGLTPREYNEFIVYWLPLMQGNAYNLISFQGIAHTSNAILNITPRPDSLLRVFMAYKALDEAIDIEPQVIPDFKREGFTVIEWGGAFVP